MLVMLLTNDKELIQLVELILADLNVTLVTTADAPKAIKQLSLIKANLLLLDMSMPDALQALGRLKADPATAAIPVVAMAYDIGLTRDEEARTALAGGADDVVLKPFGVDDLQELIHKYSCNNPKDRKDAI